MGAGIVSARGNHEAEGDFYAKRMPDEQYCPV